MIINYMWYIMCLAQNCSSLYRKVNYDGITIVATTQNKEFFDGLSSVCININHGRITSVRSKSKSKYNKK